MRFLKAYFVTFMKYFYYDIYFESLYTSLYDIFVGIQYFNIICVHKIQCFVCKKAVAKATSLSLYFMFFVAYYTFYFIF